MMDAKFEQQRQYIDQRCDQMETALQGEITSLREEIARSNTNFVPPYSQSAFPTNQGDASGLISILAVSISKFLGLNQVLTWILISFKHRLPLALNDCSTTYLFFLPSLHPNVD